MPLSEHEQRLLDQMEQQLYADDPKFSARLAEDPRRAGSRQRVLIGGFVLLAGLGLVVLGVATQLIWVGGIGFAVMVAGGAYALAPGRKASLGTVEDNGRITAHKPARRGLRGGATAARSAKPQTSGTFMQRMEARWERRRGEGGW
ncbi:DUF3040 domain-containing protein [Dermacoccaceae bacterium W4C1]